MATELWKRMEREASVVHAGPDARSAVLERIDRKRQRRRMRAGALGLGITAAIVVGALWTLQLTKATGPAAGSDSWAAIWPQGNYADAIAAQEAADAGDSTATWQRQGAEVVKRFASERFGWEAPRLEQIANAAEVEDAIGTIDDPAKLLDPTATGPVRVLVVGCQPGADATSCAGAYVTVRRLIRDDPTGIWSVTAFDSTTIGFASPTPAFSGP